MVVPQWSVSSLHLVPTSPQVKSSLEYGDVTPSDLYARWFLFAAVMSDRDVDDDDDMDGGMMIPATVPAGA